MRKKCTRLIQRLLLAAHRPDLYPHAEQFSMLLRSGDMEGLGEVFGGTFKGDLKEILAMVFDYRHRILRDANTPGFSLLSLYVEWELSKPVNLVEDGPFKQIYKELFQVSDEVSQAELVTHLTGFDKPFDELTPPPPEKKPMPAWADFLPGNRPPTKGVKVRVIEKDDPLFNKITHHNAPRTLQ